MSIIVLMFDGKNCFSQKTLPTVLALRQALLIKRFFTADAMVSCTEQSKNCCNQRVILVMY